MHQLQSLVDNGLMGCIVDRALSCRPARLVLQWLGGRRVHDSRVGFYLGYAPVQGLIGPVIDWGGAQGHTEEEMQVNHGRQLLAVPRYVVSRRAQHGLGCGTNKLVGTTPPVRRESRQCPRAPHAPHGPRGGRTACPWTGSCG